MDGKPIGRAGRLPASGVEQQEIQLDERGLTRVYLLDGNIVDICEDLEAATGVSLLEKIDEVPGTTYMVTNGVFMELMNRGREIGQELWEPGHMINANDGIDGMKENRFLVHAGGQMRIGIGAKVSPQDWSMVLLCQNHSRLTLVTNDVKLVRNAILANGEERVKTIHGLLTELTTERPADEELKKAFAVIDHPDRKKLKIRKGERLRWLNDKYTEGS